MNLIEEIAGELCKVLLPIDDRVYFGNPDSTVAVCTLSSMSLLHELADSPAMSKVNMAGRLLSENKGIDALVRGVTSNRTIRTVLLCGKDAVGHIPGHSLLCLHRNGLDGTGRIAGSLSPEPVVSLTKEEVAWFQTHITIIDRTGETNISNLSLESIS